MKILKFNHIEAENIKKGLQSATLRINDEKNISVDDRVTVVDKVHEDDPHTWRIVGQVIVDRVTVVRLGDLDLTGAHFEQFGSLAELYRQLEIFYGMPISEDQHIKVIHFTYQPYKQTQKFETIVDKNTTPITEVKIYADGGSRGNPGPSSSGFVIMDMQGTILETNGEYLHMTTNNQAEYHALELGLERARQLGVKKVHVFMDSLLVINQMKGIFKVRHQDIRTVFTTIKGMLSSFEQVEFTHVPRELNKLADAEVNRILDSQKN